MTFEKLVELMIRNEYEFGANGSTCWNFLDSELICKQWVDIIIDQFGYDETKKIIDRIRMELRMDNNFLGLLFIKECWGYLLYMEKYVIKCGE